MTSSAMMLARGAFDHACPSCPTARAARELFFSEDVLTRLGGMLGPFVVTAGLVWLLVSRLEAREQRSDDPLDAEAKS